MGAMPRLTADQRYVMTIQITGPKSPEDAEKVNAMVEELKQRFGESVSVKLAITGSKPQVR